MTQETSAYQELTEASSVAVGAALEGFGVNLLVPQVPRCVEFLQRVLGFQKIRADDNFALLALQQTLIQVHADHTYSNNPYLGLMPESGVRGCGVELRFYAVDPDVAQQRAEENNYHVLQPASNKPHGLRECFILDHDGLCYVPSRALSDAENAAVA